MRFSIYAVLGNGPNSCFMLQYSHIMRFLVKIIVYKILLIFFLHLCYSCIMRFLLGNKKRINGELSVICYKFLLGLLFIYKKYIIEYKNTSYSSHLICHNLVELWWCNSPHHVIVSPIVWIMDEKYFLFNLLYKCMFSILMLWYSLLSFVFVL